MKNKPSLSSQSNANFYLIVGLVTTIAVLATAYFGQNLVKQSMFNTRYLTKLNAANSLMQSNIDSANKLVENYAKISGYHGLLDHAMPKKENYPELIAMLENIGNINSSGLRAVSRVSDVGAPTDSSAVATPTTDGTTLKFAAEYSGTYKNLLAVFQSMQVSARPLQVTSFSLSGTGAEMTMKMTGVTYYQPTVELPFKTETVK